MKRAPVPVARGLVLDEEMFNAARAALWEYAPDVAERFTWEWFVARTSWVLIPDMENPGEWYKAECVVKLGPPYNQTVKFNVWRSADLRRNGAPLPHSHPWDSFTGHVLRGGYKEDRYIVGSTHLLVQDPYSSLHLGSAQVEVGVVHEAGDHNVVPGVIFHEVTEIIDPGGTLTMMDCGPGGPRRWGHYDPETGRYTPYREDPIARARFKEAQLALNPHLR